MKSRRMRSMPAGLPPSSDAVPPTVLDQVKRAVRGNTPATTLRRGGWSRVEVSAGLRGAAGLLGIYLSFSVLRLQELYPVLAIPRLPMVLSMIIALIVVASTPWVGWRTLWDDVPAARWQALLVVLAVVTAPFGIWMTGSVNNLVFRYSLSIVVFSASALLLRDRKALATALVVLLLAATATGLYTLSDSAATAGRSGRVRLGVSLDPNDLAQIFVALMPLTLYMALRKGGRGIHWLFGAGVLTLAVAPTESRGGILGLGAVALTLISFGTTRWKKILNIVIVAGGAIGISMLAGSDSRLTDFSDYEGGESRTAIWKRGLVWMSWRPWGYGLENFPIYFGWLNDRERSAHNSFIQIGVELGVLGLLAFAAMWYTLGRELLNQRRIATSLRGRAEGAEAEAVLATMVLASMAGTAVSGFFISKAYASVTLFVLGIATATVLGFPFRTSDPIPSGIQPPATPAKRTRRR